MDFCKDFYMKTPEIDDLIFTDVNPCSKCGSATNFCYRRIPAHFTADGRVMAMYECANRYHKHSILEPDLRAYGKNLKIAMSRAKKLWNNNNPKAKRKKERG